MIKMVRILNYQSARIELPLSEKVGQLFMPAAFINDSEEEIQQLEYLIKAHHIGGICFFHSRASAATNFEGKKEVVYNEKSFDVLKSLITRYQAVSKHPLLIAIDAEWGLAMRVESTPQYPYAITLGAFQDNDDLIYQIGKNIAHDCKVAGIHMNLAPVVDINNNPNNPVIGYRSFGENKTVVSKKAIAFMKGTQSEGVLTSAKHFPGHGDTATDSHLGLPVIPKSKEELLKNELFPFQKMIDEGVDSIMVGHLSVPALDNGKNTPSSISKEMIKNLLRDEMGFKGVVISDALNMHAVAKNFPIKGELEWRAFEAGNDILCFAEHTQEGINKILENATDSQIEESFKRIWNLKEKAIGTQQENAILEFNKCSDLNRESAKLSLTLHKGTNLDISKFRNELFTCISIFQTIENQFIDIIDNNLKINNKVELDPQSKNMHSEISDGENILICLFPPQIKPINDFGFSASILAMVNDLIATKNVVLYLFGNPYVLNHLNIEKAVAVVISYQNFVVFQEVAAAHFLGKLEAKGILPVSIKQS